MEKPLILLTNDDGINSPGLAASIAALRPLGDILVAAPITQQTSLSRAFPKVADLGRIESQELSIQGDRIPAFAVYGSPAYCVSHAILELAPRKVDLCVSGINFGENVGLSILPSGTVGAAFEADTYDIPAIAASLEVPSTLHHSEQFDEQNWKPAIHFLRQLAENVLKIGYSRDVAVWNLNVPASATEKTDWRLTRQSRQNYFVFRKPKRNSLCEPMKLNVEIEIDRKTLEPESDIYCLVIDKLVTITPLTWNLTAPMLYNRQTAVLERKW